MSTETNAAATSTATQTDTTATTEAAATTGTTLLTEAAATDTTASTEGKTETTEDKAQTEEGATAEGAPEKYDFKMPDGVTVDAAMLGSFEPVFKELNLTQTQAQKLVDIYAAQKQSEVTAQQEQVIQQHGQWVSTVKADKEIGGQNFDTTVKHAQSAIARFATPELKATLEQTGLGSHPELVRAFAKIGKAMAEDQIVTGTTAAEKGEPGLRIFKTMNK